ncbi:heparinase II/III family protein [Methylobacterium sp. CB376]|uniref:heparinase II/III domain-containing protein n=2 Tax=unclassified Methylobacterium TaxID=2615210 RepID=UPI0024B13771|nr:heparinase II/III family protein [Methylobacterium nodulans]WFT79932.1 heparinase II/III family protein [Methylobacterium nodulans]
MRSPVPRTPARLHPPASMPAAPRFLPVSVSYAGGAAAGARPDEHVVAANNRFARAVLAFSDLRPETWVEFAFLLAWDEAETAGASLDFALVGVDFLAEDRSSLDFEHVPGLSRTLLDPQSAWIAGPAYLDAGEGTRAAMVRLGFLVPDPARHATVSVRSWRNAAPFGVIRPELRQGGPARIPRRRRRLGLEPDWLDLALVPGRPLVLRGQIHAARTGREGALARVAYRNAAGEAIPPPYPDTVSTPDFGAGINLPAHRQARRFTLDLTPPPKAAAVRVGFATWEAGAEVELTGPVEIGLEDGLRLEALCGDEVIDAGTFLDRVDAALGLRGSPAPAEGVPLLLDRLRRLQSGPAGPGEAGPDAAPDPAGTALRLGRAPAWDLPPEPSWSEDPFQSPAWRLEYQSLGWLLPLAAADAARATEIALSWSRANPWGNPADGLSLHPAALAARAEVFVALLAPFSIGSMRVEPLRTLAGEAVRHGFALAEIIGQNAVARTLHHVQAAVALRAVALALPRLPLSPFWLSLARHALEEGFAALSAPDGTFSDPSLHQRLELASLGRLLAEALGEEAPGPTIGRRVGPALRMLAGLLDPGGRLPPFGDAPHGIDHRAWIGRLLGPGERATAARGSLVPARGGPGLIAARAEGPGASRAHLACAFGEQRHAHGHADCTSFVFAAEGVRWIVEAGGSGQVESGLVRHYLTSARAHNVAWPDGREPGAGTGWLAEVERLDGATAYAIGTSVHGPDYRHRRVIVTLDDLTALAVFDRFETEERPLSVEGLLHFPPDVLVALAGPRLVLASREAQRLRVVPRLVDGKRGGLALVSGRSDRPGGLQGYLSLKPGVLHPSSTLRYVFHGQGAVCGGVAIALDEGRERALAGRLTLDAVKRLLGEA